MSEQITELEAAGCIQVFSENALSCELFPPELSRVLSYLRQGDALIVTDLDRLARSTSNLNNIVRAITQAGASLRSLGNPWVNTTGAEGQLMLCVLRGIAEFETALLKRGRAHAKAKGVKLGRRAALTPAQREEVIQRVRAGESQRNVARSLATSDATISRVIRSAKRKMTPGLGFRARIRQKLQSSRL